MSFVDLPCYHPDRWAKLCTVLLEPEFKDMDTLQTAFRKFRGLGDGSSDNGAAYYRSRDCSLFGLAKAVDHFTGQKEEDYGQSIFFSKLLPFIQKAAKRLPQFFNKQGSPLPVLGSGRVGTLAISRDAVVSLLAVAFFGGYDEYSPRFYGELLANSRFPSMNWNYLMDHPSVLFPCMLHYFDRVRERNGVMAGAVTLTRKVLTPVRDQASWFASKKPMLPIEIQEEGTIEDDLGALQADFANMYLGGGVLQGGRVQEEIRFAINTECLVSLLVAPAMEDNEAVVLQGVERFSNYAGYANTFQWAGPHDDTDKTPVGQPQTTIVAFDALEPGHNQFSRANKLRELNKAFIGFSRLADEPEGAPTRPVATGNWGCGAFGGDPELKSLLQWIAASEAGRSMHYYVFGRQDLAASLRLVTSVLQKLDVGELTRAILEWKGHYGDLFDFLLSKYDPDYNLPDSPLPIPSPPIHSSPHRQPSKAMLSHEEIVPRPPMWETKGHPAYGLTKNPHRCSLDQMKAVHLNTLSTFRSLANDECWDSIHHMHYDWWMFPIDDGSRDEYNVYANDLVELKADAEYLANYREGVRLAAKAWGWDVDSATEITPKERGMGWTSWDVRLSKIIRSLWLFEQADYMNSMQKFARMLKPNGGFSYGPICLDELLYFTLPRRGGGGGAENGEGGHPSVESLSSSESSTLANGAGSVDGDAAEPDQRNVSSMEVIKAEGVRALAGGPCDDASLAAPM